MPTFGIKEAIMYAETVKKTDEIIVFAKMLDSDEINFIVKGKVTKDNAECWAIGLLSESGARNSLILAVVNGRVEKIKKLTS